MPKKVLPLVPIRNVRYQLAPSSHADPRGRFRQSDELERRLRRTVRGEVRMDNTARALYSTDASNYRQIPIGVVTPLDEADVEATIEACHAVGAPVLPRGAGTSLAGQCCNAAIVMDFSKHMNRVLALSPDRRSARVQAGVVLDRLRDAAQVHGLTFAPDPATHSRCTLGGMIGNNSCGVHALMGGKTVDNVDDLDVVLYDGTRMTVGSTSDEMLEAIIAAGGKKGHIFAGLKSIRDRFGDQIRQRFPRIPRRVSGYNLDELLPENGFNVARALVGSEGTCVTVLGAGLRLTVSPPIRRLVCVGFPNTFLAADAVPGILEHEPVGLEGFDESIPNAARTKGLHLDGLHLLPEGGATLLVEFGAWTLEHAAEQTNRFSQWLDRITPHPTYRVCTDQEASHVWRVRELALGVAAIQPAGRRAWEGWDDAAVPPDRLGAYLRDLNALMLEYRYQSPIYGHFGDGCVHLRINFDFETETGILRFREFIDRAADLVLSHDGSLSGEHGDGQARGALLPKMFGSELMGAFREFKRLWDPDNKMNPGKLIDAAEPHQDLRLGADYSPMQLPTYFSFPDDGGSLANASLRCVGVGACRKEEGGVMCPSYMATRDEAHSTRGRAHLLWELLQGELIENGWRNQDVKEALDLCLSCKACKSECPTNVDIATYKAEFLAHYYEGRRRPLEAYAFGMVDRWARMASHLPRVANALAGLRLTRVVRDLLLGTHKARTIPPLATATFRSRVRDRTRNQDRGPRTADREALLWVDTFTNYFQPQVGLAAYDVMSNAGFRVTVLPQHLCCGRPLFDFGMLNEARRYLTATVEALEPALDCGMPIVVLEPSCASVFKDEAPNLIPNDRRIQALKTNTLLLSEFLVRHAPDYQPSQTQRRILVHTHCHQRAIFNIDDDLSVLRATGGEVIPLDSGCCGMAGPFGFARQSFDISQMLAQRVLLPAVTAADATTIIVTNGFSCREQISQNTTRRASHVAEVLAGTI